MCYCVLYTWTIVGTMNKKLEISCLGRDIWPEWTGLEGDCTHFVPFELYAMNVSLIQKGK